jgi:predicted small secreted protein
VLGAAGPSEPRARTGPKVHEILCTVRFRRILAVLTLVVLAASTLTACETKVGQAAAVGGATLSDSALADFVQPGATPYTDQSGTQVVPKLNALTTWVRNELINKAIEAHGGPATTDELNAARSVINDSGVPDQAVKANRGNGYAPGFFDELTRQYVLLTVLIERLAKTSDAAKAFNLLQSGQANNAFVSAIVATKTKVDISPRYGTWDPKTLGVASFAKYPGAGAPPFVRFRSS